MYNDRRKAPRYHHDIDVTYVLGDGSALRVCRIKNISKGGATLLVDRLISPKQPITLSLPDITETIEAEVVWCQVDPEFIGEAPEDRQYVCGLRYKDEITQKVKEILDEIESRK